ncbi:hypothetical protein D9M72_512100 [compost metagenome]
MQVLGEVLHAQCKIDGVPDQARPGLDVAAQQDRALRHHADRHQHPQHTQRQRDVPEPAGKGHDAGQCAHHAQRLEHAIHAWKLVRHVEQAACERESRSGVQAHGKAVQAHRRRRTVQQAKGRRQILRTRKQQGERRQIARVSDEPPVRHRHAHHQTDEGEEQHHANGPRACHGDLLLHVGQLTH